MSPDLGDAGDEVVFDELDGRGVDRVDQLDQRYRIMPTFKFLHNLKSDLKKCLKRNLFILILVNALEFLNLMKFIFTGILELSSANDLNWNFDLGCHQGRDQIGYTLFNNSMIPLVQAQSVGYS